MNYNHLSKISLFIFLAGFIWSCGEKDEPTPPVDQVVTLNEKINNWIYDVMDEVYYWRDNLQDPIAETSDPEKYFKALLYKPTDRFSIIYPDYQELINSLGGISLDPGYEFRLVRASSTSDDVLIELLYIKKNSPASEVDLQRGDLIIAINGTVINTTNYKTLLKETDAPHKVTAVRYDFELEKYVQLPEISLTPVQLSENPNFLDTVYTVGNEKIGYLVYNFFAPGTDKKYDKEMDDIFAKLKAENVNNLVLDLRYNGGGYVSSAVNLASLIAPGINSSDIFSRTRYNAFLSLNVPQLSNVKTNFMDKATNIGNQLTNKRLYVLTSGGTASASELIINGLKPYMEVILIGKKTYGKNVGSIAIEDEKNKENKYGLLPIVTQSFNSLDQSDYSTGFEPNIEVDEFKERLLPLGDINETMLRTAIAQITGIPSSARINQFERTEISNSLEHKIRMGKMIEGPIKLD